jgi:hypothetical protein
MTLHLKVTGAERLRIHPLSFMSILINNLYSCKFFSVVIHDAIPLPIFMSYERHLRFGETDMSSNIDEDNTATNGVL